VDEGTEGYNGEHPADCLSALKCDVVHDKFMSSIHRVTNSCGFMLTKISCSLPSDDYCMHREIDN
jgi:hypothetical protein